MYHPDMISRLVRDRQAARLAEVAFSVQRPRRMRRSRNRVHDHPPSVHLTFGDPRPAPAA